ncbi:Subunit of the multiprotein cohesin complex [Trichophyton interdigitale]|uniref:Structural maintenance of chromosomes protein n=1 Tax=Trichophyton interdigitale TaxID=101480 RepID=A0A9P4YN85_9EURO|nr:Subunit of the multiprotein cohesin complex [Trichophyton interdigitale]KAF3899565.1 Subunit of the multiprotein cohesin complex [Trichophyton interdigitale]KAG8210949.1 Subunit of the multiprotein cohesin complex [Trichophyton interdigitale]
MGKLIRLELFNFKSYKGHHTLLFGDAYFTSIIGPNGSGKSNSMDAISFVLGIKSSHLRSTHLRDLVYRGRVLRTAKINDDGSASKDPAAGESGGQNGEVAEEPAERNDPKSAWVMAVYEDDAGEEQQWKRSITSQGVSEYRINNRVVTAQQYNDALEAENILIKARNFLVFQGDVESIASQSPKDLTRLIEQISGSLESKADYERLKAEQEEAAEHLNFQLNRRRGINSEIKQYQEQKREAETYARKAEERDQAIITHILWKLFHFQRLIVESSAEIQKYQDELKEFRRGVEKYEKNLEDAKVEHARVGRDVSRAEKGIKLKEKEIEETTNSLVPINEKIEITGKKVAKYATRVDEVSKEALSQAKTVKQLEKDLKIVEKAQNQWENEWKQTIAVKGIQLTDADLQEYSRLKEEVSKKSSNTQLKLDNLKRQRKADAEAVNNMKSNLESVEWQAKNLQTDMDHILERKAAIAATIKSTSKEIDATKKELNSLTSERLRVAQMRTELEEKLQVTLKKLLEADDGRQQSEKEQRTKEMIATLKRIFPGVKGRVSELCQPKQKKYAEAVSTVLGRHFDAIVVDNEKTAKECIQHLRDQRAGQATFIPLETIQVKALNSNLKGMHRAMRPAIETVDFDSSVSRAITYACGNSIVCDDLATAKYLCYEKGVEAKAVTLDGTVIHKGGLMTGGRGPGQRNAKRWEDTEIANLNKLKDKLMADLANLPKAHRRGSEEESLQGQLTGLEQRLAYSRDELSALEKNLESKSSELDFAKRQIKSVQPKYREKLALLETLDQSIEEIQSSVTEVEDKVYRDFCKRLGYKNIQEYDAQQGSLQEEAAEKKLQFTTQKTKIENQLSFEKQRLQATEARIDSLKTQSQKDEAMIAELEAERGSIQERLDELNDELTSLNETLQNQQNLFSESSENLAQQRRELQRRSKNVEATLKTISGLEADVQRHSSGRYTLIRRCKLEDINIPLTADSEPLDKLPIDELVQPDPDAMEIDEDSNNPVTQNHVVQDFGIEVDFSSLGDSLKEESDDKLDEELQERVRSLNNELDKMAPNMRAIERLEGVESKLRTIEKDFEDSRKRARKAKDDFEEVMQRRSELFNKAFTHISEQIEPIYRDLTRTESYPMGGKAYLDIEDSEEPYLDGIKYHAMPPLKRFRDMEHLSGGEKTMAALALLFAIHSYQPSPFFVLDEVDAALDNANVSRIANYIRDHAAPGMQFIVISLKTGLFQVSEALVGIYRDQAANSSKALTLDVSLMAPFDFELVSNYS